MKRTALVFCLVVVFSFGFSAMVSAEKLPDFYELLKSGYISDQEQVASHPDCPEEVLYDILLADFHRSVKNRVAARDNISNELLETIISSGWRTRNSKVGLYATLATNCGVISRIQEYSEDFLEPEWLWKGAKQILRLHEEFGSGKCAQAAGQ